MPTVRVIAKQAGVSTATVSRVLNNHPAVSAKARAKVLEAAAERGPRPGSPRNESANIAFVYTDTASLSSPFDMALLNGLVQAIEEFDMDLLILDARRSRLTEESYTQMFARKDVRGAVLRTTLLSRHTCAEIWKSNFPAVFVGERFEEQKACFVDAASRQASSEAVQHLIDLGHRRVAVATNVVDDTDHQDRVAGYTDALKASGVELDQRLMLRVPANLAGGRQLIRRIVGMGEAAPTAIYVTDPQSCIGAVNEARSIGIRIPEDLSIVGFDDSEARASVHPHLSSVCQDAATLGREAMNLLAKLIADPSLAPLNRVLLAWFEANDSTAPPRLGPITTAVKPN